MRQLRFSSEGDVEFRPVRGGELMLSMVGLGGFELGPDDEAAPDIDRAVALVNAAIDAGINWIDTSENYLETRNESLIGETLSRVSGELLVATKVAPEAAITGGGSGFRPDEIHAACRSSLRRLGRDHIDLYFLHWPTEQDISLAETWGAMSELAEWGLVRAIGMSNYELSDIEQCHRQRAVDVIQDGLSLIDYLGARETFRRCGEIGIAVTTYEPLASGILTDKTPEQILATWTGPWTESGFFQRLLAPGRAERSFAVADGMRPLAAKLGVSVAQLAIAWVLRQAAITATIAGSSRPGHIHANAEAVAISLDPVIDELESLIALGPTFND